MVVSWWWMPWYKVKKSPGCCWINMFSRIPCHLTIYADRRSHAFSQSNPNPKNFKIWLNRTGENTSNTVTLMVNCTNASYWFQQDFYYSYWWSSGTPICFWCFFWFNVVLATSPWFFHRPLFCHWYPAASAISRNRSVHLKQCALDLWRSQWCSPWGLRLVVPTSFAPIW